jgi:metallo-beta-lactamase family protein
MSPSLTFLGAAGTVTGSCTLIEANGHRILIDCGMFQGPKSLKELNYRPFPFLPSEISAVLLTHAHIDHSGLIPKLHKGGFRGPVLATAGTRDLLTYMLPDSGYIQEMEVERLNKRRHQHGEEPVQPIYGRMDAERSLDCLRPVKFGDWTKVVPGLQARYWPAGHILGAASIELEILERGEKLALLFSGDIGTADRALHARPEGPSGLDYVTVESTYGDRLRGEVTTELRRRTLLTEVRAALSRGGNLIIPVFAVERTQELLFDLGLLIRRGELAQVPIFLDSPLAVHATEVFQEHADELGDAAGEPHPFDGPQVHFVETAEQSEKLSSVTSGAIIMAASGMCEAGRIRHHLLNHLWRPQSTVLIVGYQAPGTLGRLLLDGARAVRIMGHETLVQARIREIDLYSAHADQKELVQWVRDRQPIRRGLILMHGEPPSADALEQKLSAELADVPAILRPNIGDRLSLSGSGDVHLDVSGAGGGFTGPDWHNLRSRFLLDLNESLRTAATDAERTALLKGLAELLCKRP